MSRLYKEREKVRHLINVMDYRFDDSFSFSSCIKSSSNVAEHMRYELLRNCADFHKLLKVVQY